MTSSADLEKWKSLGGTVQEVKKRKRYIAPTGEEYGSWEAANIYLERYGAKSLLQLQPGKAFAPVPMPGSALMASITGDAGAAPDQDTAARRVGSGRQVAQGAKAYKDRGGARNQAGDKILIKEELEADTEQDALKRLSSVGATGPHRLVEFRVMDEAGTLQPLELLGIGDTTLFVSGVLYPSSGKQSQHEGVRLEKFGPLQSWAIRHAGDTYQVCLMTSEAEYTATRPAASYKKLWAHFTEQTDIAAEVQCALLPSLGGNPAASMDEVIARLARAKVGKAYAGPREALRLTGRFVLAQLLLASGGVEAAARTATLPFVTALEAEMADMAARGPRAGNGITIRDVSMADAPDAAGGLAGVAEEKVDARVEADNDFARQLQAKLDAEEARGGSGRRPGARAQQAYLKIDESEIANDYPEPAQYEKEEEETDELLLLDEDMMDAHPDDLPRRLLTDFAVYNAEGLYASLELLPMWAGIEPDTALFASGRVLDDNGEWAGGQTLGATAAGGGDGSGEQGASGKGMWLALSQVQEWVVEFSCDMLFISIRTDVAWYRLSRPTAAYAPWFNVVLKCARMAVSILQSLTEEARAARKSFGDIIKSLAATPEDQPTFVSKKADAVERFVVVHGQIMLNQFRHYHIKAVANSAFVSSLKAKMEQRRHCKLYSAPKAKTRGVRANPMRDRASVRQKPMTATATAMVKAIWRAYFLRTGQAAPDGANENDAGAANAATPEQATAVIDDVNAEDDDAPEEDALAAASPAPKLAAAAVSPVQAKRRKKGASAAAPAWVGKPLRSDGGCAFYRAVEVGGVVCALGDIVTLDAPDKDEDDDAKQPEQAHLAQLQALWQMGAKAKMAQVRLMVRGEETVLADAANPQELFATANLRTMKVGSVTGKVAAARVPQRDFHASFGCDALGRPVAPVAAAADASNPAALTAAPQAEVEELYYKSLYLPEQGMFAELPANLCLGTCLPEPDEDGDDDTVTASGEPGGFIRGGVTYSPGDCVYVTPNTFDSLEDEDAPKVEVPAYAAKGGHHKGGANVGLRAYGIAQILPPKARGKAGTKKGAGGTSSATAAAPTKVRVQRFWRPEDVGREAGYRAGFWDVYASAEEEVVEVPIEEILRKCTVLPAGCTGGFETHVCVGSFSRASKQVGEPPAQYALASQGTSKGKAALSGKGKDDAADPAPSKAVTSASAAASTADLPADGLSLATMDIFAGCGGLSEGLHRAGAAVTKWAIEYEGPAADAFRLNNPEAATWCANCNVLLTAAMDSNGRSDQCDASPEAREAAKQLDAATLASLPAPGEVDFLCGGPPCQGYSGMNRFNKGTWSLVQNSMVMAYLSFADFYRPRYFLLENVRNFVSHNKSHAFRLTLRSLLDMGYQVRFGVLNAGNYGVSQSRKRTFIWGVAPGNTLPDWPAPLHVFRSPQLTIKLPGGAQYTAVPQQAGAPLRTVTVKDAIGDLPPITNGACIEEMPYDGPAISAFQKAIRGDCEVLRDHICKEMNELNLERCRCIPKGVPGADWRMLQEIVAADPQRALVKGQPLVPWCLPNTADRHNGWRGLFGRLDAGGHFPTSTTDPQPMGKVGQVFHPTQDRIVSVRECARAQGFPDSFRFHGNVHNKHRQIGNAVPVPLAKALGRQLRAALEATAHAQAQALLSAQLGG